QPDEGAEKVRPAWRPPPVPVLQAVTHPPPPQATSPREPNDGVTPGAAAPLPPPTQPPSGQWRPIPANRHLSRFSTDSTPAASNPSPAIDQTQAAGRGGERNRPNRRAAPPAFTEVCSKVHRA